MQLSALLAATYTVPLSALWWLSPYPSLSLGLVLLLLLHFKAMLYRHGFKRSAQAVVALQDVGQGLWWLQLHSGRRVLVRFMADSLVSHTVVLLRFKPQRTHNAPSHWVLCCADSLHNGDFRALIRRFQQLKQAAP